jgi:DNA-binding YbaB/EbfC family protein
MAGLGDLMKQAQRLKAEMERIQAEAATKTVEGSAGGGMVTAIANGKGELLSVKIDPAAVREEDLDMLQDLITAAANDALQALSFWPKTSRDSPAASAAGASQRRFHVCDAGCVGGADRPGPTPPSGPKTAQHLLKVPHETRPPWRALVAEGPHPALPAGFQPARRFCGICPTALTAVSVSWKVNDLLAIEKTREFGALSRAGCSFPH